MYALFHSNHYVYDFLVTLTYILHPNHYVYTSLATLPPPHTKSLTYDTLTLSLRVPWLPLLTHMAQLHFVVSVLALPYKTGSLSS